MKSIWKFECPIARQVSISMPKKAEILCFQLQGDTPYIWTIVNVDAEYEDRNFYIVGTGHDFPYDMGINPKYIGTIQMLGGNLVWHLFEAV